jgi:hypothetical protein
MATRKSPSGRLVFRELHWRQAVLRLYEAVNDPHPWVILNSDNPDQNRGQARTNAPPQALCLSLQVRHVYQAKQLNSHIQMQLITKRQNPDIRLTKILIGTANNIGLSFLGGPV